MGCNEGDLSDIRKAAKAIIDKNVPGLTQYTSDGPPEMRKTFDRLTNGTPKTHPSRHDYLVDVWAKGSQETCCMDFVAWYGKQLAAALGVTMTENLGRFDLVEKGIAKPSAWIKTAPSPKPKYGDILLHTGIHIDVAIGFDGNHLCRVAAGQGVVKQRDIIKRVTGQFDYNYQKLKGWVDIDVYFGGAAAPTPGPTPTSTIMPPPWLYGWWKVTWRGEAFLYYFYRDGSVAWTQNMKQSTSQAPAAVQGRGRFVVDHSTNIIVNWDSGSLETFKSTSNTQLTGTWKSKDGSQAPISAAKVQSGGWV
jgi:hypothetical protein